MPDSDSLSTTLSSVLLILVILTHSVVCVPRNEFYPFGTDPYGDSELPSYDDVSSPEVPFPAPIRFYGGSYDYAFVNQNGFVSFESELPYFSSQDLYEYTYPIVSAFLSDVDVRSGSTGEVAGHVYYRLTTSEPGVLHRATETVRSNFADAADFQARFALVATWDRVGHYDGKQDKRNTFQLVLSGNDTTTYVEFLYADNGIEWARSSEKFPLNQPVVAQLGFVQKGGGADHFDPLAPFRLSKPEDVVRIYQYTNRHLPGAFLFRVSGPTIMAPGVTVKYEEGGDSLQDNEEEEDEEYEYSEYEAYPTGPSEDGGSSSEMICLDDPYHGQCPEHCHLAPTVGANCKKCDCPHGEQEENLSFEERKEAMPEPVPAAMPCPDDPHKEYCPSHCFLVLTGHCQACQCPQDGNVGSPKEEKHRNPKPDSGIAPAVEQPVAPAATPAPVPVQEPNPALLLPAPAQVPIRVPVEPRNQDFCFAGHSCPPEALCENYANGYCCRCNEGFIGNGHICLKDDESQRINGKLAGKINDVSLTDVDLHTYAVIADGRTYTALSPLAPVVGRSFPFLAVIGNTMGWLFGKTDGSSVYNGFELTGGTFNSTAAVHISDRYTLTVQLNFVGRDSQGYFKANLYIVGTLPDIPENTEVNFGEYSEEFRRVEPGTVKSYSSKTVAVDGQKFQVTVDQTIKYRECAHRTFAKDDSVLLKVDRNYVVYDPIEKIARFAAGNVISKLDNYIEDDPCRDGSHSCTSDHMACVREGSRHRCICREGYNLVHDSQLPLQSRCVDIDECAEDIHRCSPDAICRNEPGTYACLCRAGFEGDGYRCTKRKQTCEDLQCHADASCELDVTGNPICLCRPGFEGDGYACRRAQDRCQAIRCDPNGRCVIDESGTATCVCNFGFTGDGYVCRPAQDPCQAVRCDPNGRCVVDASGTATCACNPGFTGDGHTCKSQVVEQPEVPDRPSQRTCESTRCAPDAHCRYDSHRQPICVCNEGFEGDEGTACRLKLCSSHEECGEYAYCTYSDQFQRYQCRCRPKFTGDGVTCVPERQSCDVAYDCHPNADCVWQQETVQGSYKCRCRSGFTGDGYSCVEIKKPEDISCNVLNNCHPKARCNFDQQTSKYTCQCEAGYSGDGYFCSRIEAEANNKCKSSEDCHPNAHCVFRDASYEYFCECLPGYKGDGFSNCEPADECFPGSEKTGCGELATCSFDQEKVAYTCKCIGGYTGDGHTCTPEIAISCNTDPTLCHYNAECRYSSRTHTYTCHCRDGFTGDGYQSCQQEQVTCKTHNICDQNAGCHPTADRTSYTCVCNPGYDGDGFTCKPIQDCMVEPNICDPNAVCVSENLRYVCRCKEGYHGSGQKCALDSQLNGKILIFSHGMSLVQRGMMPSDVGKQIVIAPYQVAVGIDYDCSNGQIYWSDVSGHSIRKANLDGSSVSVVYDADLNSPEGIALDWFSRNIYYADSIRDEIGVITMDGKYRYTVLTNGLVNPRALAIDFVERKIYFSDWHRQRPLIGRLNLDGTEREAFVTDRIALPNGLVVLQRRREVCWADAGTQRLECIAVNKGGRRVVFAPLGYPFGLTAADEEMFYWTDWEDKLIHYVSVYGGQHKTMKGSLGASGKMYGIVAIPETCFPGSSPCAQNNGGCRYVCLPDKYGSPKCVCPQDVPASECDQQQQA